MLATDVCSIMKLTVINKIKIKIKKEKKKPTQHL